ncbi:MAG: 3-isopropylmalate dehydrogenase [Armatimonadetes bacterium]|nr:3-isopropylmalate dehydrogenase [Armatimonadota bacterium]
MPPECRVAILPGDGIGPEVLREATGVLLAVGRRFGIRFVLTEALIGGAAIEATGLFLPPDTLTLCRTSDAVLLGAVGGPQWDDLPPQLRPERGLLDLRQHLKVFANLRPARALPLADVSPLRPERIAGTDLLIVRELTGGIYFGEPRYRSRREAVDTLRYGREEIARVARVAFTLARTRRRRVTSVDKANVLASSQLWREVVEEEARRFPDVALEHMLVDTCAMRLVREPAAFDVILTENLFGDILSDLAGGVVGSIGVLPSASLGAEPPTVYEPVHGAAPDIVGRGIANPLGAILSVAMMLRHSFGLAREAMTVEEAVARALQRGLRTPDLGGRAGTAEVGGAVATAIIDAEGSVPPARAGAALDG